MNVRAVLLVSLVASACHSHGPSVENAVRVNDASEEVLAVIMDEVDRNGAETSPMAFAFDDPGAVSAGTIPTFTWSAVAVSRHGTDTGTFVWLHFEGSGMAEPLEVIAVDVSQWTPDADSWAKLTAATGAITVHAVTAIVDRGVIQQGPFVPASADVSFTIAP
jgi:hypothetical protein